MSGTRPSFFIYSVSLKYSNQRGLIKFSEKNDYGEYQKISESYFQLENGFYSNDVAFSSVYDKTFELGTIYVMAEIKETTARKRNASQRSRAPRAITKSTKSAQKKPPTPKLHRGRPQPPTYKRPPSKFNKTKLIWTMKWKFVIVFIIRFLCNFYDAIKTDPIFSGLIERYRR